MPKNSYFETYRGYLSSWLRSNFVDAPSINPKDRKLYNENGKDIVAGWRVSTHLPNSYTTVTLEILIDSRFPFSHIKIAYKDKNNYLIWPHFEEHGYICLPLRGYLPVENLEYSIKQRIKFSLELICSCQDRSFILSESRKEFVTYWNRSSDDISNSLSLVDLNNSKTRNVIACWLNSGWVFAENDTEANNWITNQNHPPISKTNQAIFGFIDTPPELPLPITTREHITRLIEKCPDVNSAIGRLNPNKPTLFLFACRSNKSIGLLGFKISELPLKTARKPAKAKRKKTISAAAIKSNWSRYSVINKVKIERVDSHWVHGRGLDISHTLIKSKKVVVLGCGSLGSQVASRLAQAGAGHLTIIDPQSLSTSNVGRHFLGVNDACRPKAIRTAKVLSEKYPHSTFHGIKQRFQDALRDNPKTFYDADLFVSCIGDTDHDLTWDDIQSGSLELSAPTVFGWIGTQGATGHALALTNSSPRLSCIFHPDGLIRHANTTFHGSDVIKVEPGCGTEFQPYGPLATAQVELMVTRLCLDILANKVQGPQHRIYACSTDDLHELGGKWTEYHQRYRPSNYLGQFEYEIPVEYCGDCYRCLEMK